MKKDSGKKTSASDEQNERQEDELTPLYGIMLTSTFGVHMLGEARYTLEEATALAKSYQQEVDCHPSIPLLYVRFIVLYNGHPGKTFYETKTFHQAYEEQQSYGKALVETIRDGLLKSCTDFSSFPEKAPIPSDESCISSR